MSESRKKTKNKPPLYQSKHDWSKVDWKKDDLHISMILGTTKAAVRIARKRMGVPKLPTPKRRSFGTFAAHVEVD